MLSMTGHGRASHRERGLDIEVDVRSVNHRFFTLKQSLPPGMSRFEPEIERQVRERTERGSVTVAVSLKSSGSNGSHLPDVETVRALYQGLRKIQKGLGIPGQVTMEALLGLPQVWSGPSAADRSVLLWPKIGKVLGAALDDHAKMRAREGAGIVRDLKARLRGIEKRVAEVRTRVPVVREAYQKRLEERMTTLLASHKDVEVARPDLLKEVALHADRIDISEELQRLGSHVKQFDKILGEKGVIGRKIEFLTQEMVRETNTLSAKANDTTMTRLAVEIKSELEKIKQQAENVE